MERDLSYPFAEGPGDASIVACQEVGARSEFAEAVLAGFARKPRSIPCRFFYDANGAALFEKITALPEYYPTRVETALLATHGGEIAKAVRRARVLIEFGSGSSRKTDLLLRALPNITHYVPIDVSRESLKEAAEFLAGRHRGLIVRPLFGDFTCIRSLPAVARERSALGFFSGSTIGNLAHGEARGFLTNAAHLLGPGSAFLVGVDLKKDPAILLPAYNDSDGVTAAFNMNLLTRINRELDGDIDLGLFTHDAVYDEVAGRIEMYLESRARQTVHVLGRPFHFTRGERIHTENSHKYSVSEFQALAASAGWTPAEVWTDADQLFSLHLLRAV